MIDWNDNEASDQEVVELWNQAVPVRLVHPDDNYQPLHFVSWWINTPKR